MCFKKWISVLCIALVMVSLFPSTAKMEENTKTETQLQKEAFDEKVQREFKVRKVTCGAVVIFKDGKLLYQMPYGRYNYRLKQPTNIKTDFKLASMTKFITAIGLMTLYDQGKFDLDAPIQEILPFVTNNPYFPKEIMTPRQILSHTSSIESKSYLAFDWSKIRRGTQYFQKKSAPGEKYLYSNINGGLFGSMVEALSNQSLWTYMNEAVFSPLSIEGYYLLQDHPAPQTVASMFDQSGKTVETYSYYVKKGEKLVNECDPQGHIDLAVGSLFMDAMDISVLLNMLLNGGIINGVRILSEETVQLMETPQHKIEGSTVSGESRYTLGMEKYDGLQGGSWYGHQGIYDGLSTDAYYQKETGLTVVVIANGHKRMRTDGIANIAREIMKMATDYVESGEKFLTEE